MFISQNQNRFASSSLMQKQNKINFGSDCGGDCGGDFGCGGDEGSYSYFGDSYSSGSGRGKPPTKGELITTTVIIAGLLAAVGFIAYKGAQEAKVKEAMCRDSVRISDSLKNLR